MTAREAQSRVWMTPFFVVGPRKLIVMSVVTFGLYQLHWFFQHWRRVRDVQEHDVWPAARGLFAPLTCYGLFRRIEESAAASGVASRYGAVLLTAVYVPLVFVGRLPYPTTLLAMFAVAPLVSAQRTVNAMPWAQALPQAARNDRLTRGNWAAVAVGMTCWCLVGIGALLTSEVLDEPTLTVAELSTYANELLPRTLEGGMVLERSDVTDGNLTYRVVLKNLRQPEVDVDGLRARVRRATLANICEPETIEHMVLQRGAAVVHAVHDSDGALVAVLETRRDDCRVRPIGELERMK